MIQRLVHMANQAAAFFRYGEAEAIKSTVDHRKSVWEPPVRRDHLANEARAGLLHIAFEAAKAMVARDTAAKKPA
jgi:hypothetical protein